LKNGRLIAKVVLLAVIAAMPSLRANAQSGKNQPTAFADRRYVRGVPNCGHQAYDEGNVIVENVCDITVSITWTSSSDTCWGTALSLSPTEHRATGCTQEEVSRAGGLDLFTCPGDSGPVDEHRQPIGRHYKGEYACVAP
jgi:hypothetical protein